MLVVTVSDVAECSRGGERVLVQLVEERVLVQLVEELEKAFLVGELPWASQPLV